ncbi:Berardinelli-Seip congenital lipodystrophy 2 (seipin) [Blastocladiella emersonii ATCC 22665]|nr:Berardinelli-Seip congenital lipodystrophy 2 (seipin) [Blastocladiella emersonii ATCC 22665]
MLRDAVLFVFAPVLSFVEPHYQSLHAFLAAPKTHRFVLKSLVFAALFALLFIGAVLAYAGFYSLYVPQVGFVQDVPLVAAVNRTLAGHVLLASLPDGPVPALLSSNQPYDLSLVLRFPASPHNLDLGTFAASLTLLSPHAQPLYWAAQPVTLTYVSSLANTLTTLFWALPTVFGYVPQVQTVHVPLLSGVLSPAPVAPLPYGLGRPFGAETSAAALAAAAAAAGSNSGAAGSSWWPLSSSSTSSSSSNVAAADDAAAEEPLDVAAVTDAVNTANKGIPPAALRAYASAVEHWRFAHRMDPNNVPTPPPTTVTVSLPAAAAPASDNAATPAAAEPRRPRTLTTIVSEADRALAHAVVRLSAPAHVYAATLRVDAQFYGLRYLMYHWFFTSASIGVGLLMVWEVIIGLAVWRVVIGKKITVEVLEEDEDDDDEEDYDDDEEHATGSESGSDDDGDDRSSSSSSSSDDEDGGNHHHRRHRAAAHQTRDTYAAAAPAPAAIPPRRATPSQQPQPQQDDDATVLGPRSSATTAAKATTTTTTTTAVRTAPSADSLRQRRTFQTSTTTTSSSAAAGATAAELVAGSNPSLLQTAIATPAPASPTAGEASSSSEEDAVKV